MDSTEAVARPTPASERGGVLSRNPLSRLSFGHIVMISAGLLAFLLNVMIIRSKGETVEVLVAANPISAGTRLADRDITYELVDAEGPFVDRVLSRETLTHFIGQVVVRDVDSGAPLLADDLRPVAAPDNGRAMSIPITADHAVGAALYVGDRVDVISVEDGAGRFIATGIEVLGVASGESRLTSDRFGITVAVTEGEALAIAEALDEGRVHLLRSTGSTGPRAEMLRPAS